MDENCGGEHGEDFELGRAELKRVSRPINCSRSNFGRRRQPDDRGVPDGPPVPRPRVQSDVGGDEAHQVEQGDAGEGEKQEGARVSGPSEAERERGDADGGGGPETAGLGLVEEDPPELLAECAGVPHGNGESGAGGRRGGGGRHRLGDETGAGPGLPRKAACRLE